MSNLWRRPFGSSGRSRPWLPPFECGSLAAAALDDHVLFLRVKSDVNFFLPLLTTDQKEQSLYVLWLLLCDKVGRRPLAS